MALTAFTKDPTDLLSSIKQAIDEEKVDTWAYDSMGDFFHTPDQWKGKAWFRPSAQQGMLAFGLIGQKGVPMTRLVYGVYHGRFIEMLLVHFDTQFDNVSATALGNSVDMFK